MKAASSTAALNPEAAVGPHQVRWKQIPLRHCFRLVSGATPSTTEPKYWDGEIVWVTPDDLGRLDGRMIATSERQITSVGAASIGDRTVPAGSLVLSTRAPIGHLGVAEVPMSTNQGCKSLVPQSDVDVGYAYYQLLSRRGELRSRGTGTTFAELSRAQLAAIPFWHPPVEEQCVIADFLDRETEKIDALVAKKQRLLHLLQEKRTALISHIVTKGLDPDVPKRDSGMAWLGSLPRHWAVSPLVRLVDPKRPVMYGIVLPGPDFPGGVPIIKGGDVSPERLIGEQLNKTDPEIESRHARSRMAGGDIVYAIRGSIGAAAVVPSALEGANLTQDTARVAPRSGVEVGWLMYALQSRPVFAQLEAGAVGATIRGINIFSLKRAVLPVPPRNEQVAIRDELDLHMCGLDGLLRAVQDAMDRLREYRSALVTAAVTGQIRIADEVVAWTG